MGGMFSKPKVDTRAADRAEAEARKAAAEKLRSEKQAMADDEYRRKRQIGKASTIMSSVDDGSGRSLLGG